MKKTNIYYKNIFMYGSNQFCGNIEEYFSIHARKLVIFTVMPRVKNSGNCIREYKNGDLIKSIDIDLSENIFMYYIKLIYFHWFILLKYFSKNEKFFLIGGHPVLFFGLSLQKTLRKVKHIYWIGDYFPGDSFVIRVFELVKKHYHNVIPFNIYLSDGINKVFNNGKVVDTYSRKTVMWGVKSAAIATKPPNKDFVILFVGLVKESQGLEHIFEYLKKNDSVKLKIVGVCGKELYAKYKRIIKNYKISTRVDFANKFVNDEELSKIALNCHLGVAIYDTSSSNPTFYTDPGKVKTYTQLNLPVVMTNTSGVVGFVSRYKAGIVIDSIKELPEAIAKIKSDYDSYLKGLVKFNKYFSFDKYYRKRFSFLEK